MLTDPIHLTVRDRYGIAYPSPLMQAPYVWVIQGPNTRHGMTYVPILIPATPSPEFVAHLFENALNSLDDLVTSLRAQEVL